MPRNLFPGPCDTCAKRVAAEAGFRRRGPSGGWQVVCAECAPPDADASEAAPTLPTIRVTLRADSSVKLTPAAHLGDRFRAYLDASRACTYVRDEQAQKCAPAVAAGVLDALDRAGFLLDVAPDAKLAIHAGGSALRAGIVAADDRAEAIDLALKARGLGLYGFQREGVRWLASRVSALLADEMGLGKTVQALVAIPEGAPVLVICPAVAKGVWLREAAKWRPDLRPVVLSGRGSFRWPRPGEMVITNYDVLPAVTGERWEPKLPANLPAPPAGCVVIGDEAHACKSADAKRTRAVRAIVGAVLGANGRAWALTATPQLNREPTELWGVLSTFGLQREAIGNFDELKRLFNATADGYKGAIVWGFPRTAEVAEALRRVSLRRERREVLPDLPTKTYRRIPVTLDAAVVRKLDKIGVQLDADKLAEVLAEGSPGFEKIAEARKILATAKTAAAVEMVEEYEAQGEPLIVFSAHRAPIDLIGAREGWAAITGDTPNAQRSEIEAKFQRGELRGIAATIAAGGVAITLTRAAHVLFIDRAWTPALNAQAEDRACRIGQTRGVVISHLVAEHAIDERVADLLDWKQRIIAGSVEASRRMTVQPVEIPALDFQRLDQASAREREAIAAVEAEAEARVARGRAKRTQNEERYAEEVKAEKKRAKLARLDQQAAETADERTPPTTDLQVWIAAGLAMLADLDPDRAREQNGVGYNASDAGLGHSLAYLANAHGLTREEWAEARAMLRKYHGQIGREPGRNAGNE
jgi:hypothetical protein